MDKIAALENPEVGRSGYSPHLMVFEPGSQGHHLPWLAYISEDLLSAGFRLSVAADLRPGNRQKVYDHLGPLAARVNLFSAFSKSGDLRHGSTLKALCACFKESGADEVMMPNFDDIASSCLRKAAIGFFPPSELHSKINGIYFRPRFLDSSRWSAGHLIKSIGFGRLSRAGWLKRVYILDEYLIDTARRRFPITRFAFLPDTWSGNFSQNQQVARREMGVPQARLVLLHYGLGSRRKGLHHVIQALADPGLQKVGVFLLCVGILAADREIIKGLDKLEQKGMAKVINRHVNQTEEEYCFAASDAVLLPYVDHFGSSGVLARAAAAQKPVIASNQGLLGQRVKQHQLGLLFTHRKVDSLIEALRVLPTIDSKQLQHYQEAGRQYAVTCDRNAFKRALVAPFLKEEAISV